MPTRQEEEFVEPLFPSRDLDESVRFYKALGFEVLEHARAPYPYAEVRRGRLWLYFTHLAPYAKSKAFGARTELAQIDLPQEARERYRHELEAADVLERWLAGEGGGR